MTDPLAQALLKFQGMAPSIPLDATNPHFKNKYASEAAIRAALRKPLIDCGLVVSQWPTTVVPGSPMPALRTRVTHADSGVYQEDTMLLILDKQNAQGQGSALTYAKRQALTAILGLVGEEDDDGHAASEVRKEGGLGDAPVPKTWAQVKKWHEQFGSWPLAEEMSKAYMIFQWNATDSKELNKEQRALVLQKAAGATVWLAENGSNAIGPLPPSVDLYQRAWAHVLNGTVLEGIEWKAPNANDVPDYEAERIADEVVTGP